MKLDFFYLLKATAESSYTRQISCSIVKNCKMLNIIYWKLFILLTVNSRISAKLFSWGLWRTYRKLSVWIFLVYSCITFPNKNIEALIWFLIKKTFYTWLIWTKFIFVNTIKNLLVFDRTSFQCLIKYCFSSNGLDSSTQTIE